MIKLGTTTLPLCGWWVDPGQPAVSRMQRLAGIRFAATHLGLDAIELTLDLAAVYPNVFDTGYFEEVAALQRELGLVCTVHLPFLWVDPASLNEPIRRASVASVRDSLALTQPVDVTSYVLHLWGATSALIAAQLKQPRERRLILEAVLRQADRSLEELCQLVDPGRLCVENLEAPPFEAVVPLVERHGTSICLDVGHLFWHDDDVLSILAEHSSRIREVHLHDASVHTGEGGFRRVSDHLPLGKGQVDYTGLLAALEEMDFQGAVILELNSRADLEESLRRLRSMPPAAKAI